MTRVSFRLLRARKAAGKSSCSPVLSGRVRLLIIASVAVAICAGSLWLHSPVRLVYNASPSVDLGWYLYVPASHLAVGMLVIARLPSAAAQLAAERDYLPITVPIVKRVAARRGELVCEHSRILSIDGDTVARALVSDSDGRPLPAWSGCVRLIHDEYLLLGDRRPDSYDSRYFGPVTAHDIFGRAIPLWTRR